MIHTKCLERKMSFGLAAFDLLTSIKVATYPIWWTRWCSGYHARLVLRGDAGSNPARDTLFQRRVSKATGKLFTSFFH